MQHTKLYNSGFVAGNLITFECIEGYEFKGTKNNAIRCLPNGKWTRLQGGCWSNYKKMTHICWNYMSFFSEKNCLKPIVAEQTVIIGNSYSYKDKVTLSCPDKKKYELVCNRDGIWEGNRDTSC